MAINFSGISGGISDFGTMVSDFYASDADKAKASADEAQGTAARAGAQADLLKGQGDLVEGEMYGTAASLADTNAAFTAQSTAIQTAQADRSLFGVLGSESAGIASSGFGEGGSAGDILRSSASQGALNRAVLGQQGLITEAGYQEQASSYRSMQTAAGIASQAEDVSATGEQAAAQGYDYAAQAERSAATGADISGIISGIAGVASIAGAFV